MWRELDHVPNLSIALANLGLTEWLIGDAEQATARLEEALSRSRSAQLSHTVAISLRDLGLFARSHNQYARAELLLKEAAAQELPPAGIAATPWPGRSRALDGCPTCSTTSLGPVHYSGKRST